MKIISIIAAPVLAVAAAIPCSAQMPVTKVVVAEAQERLAPPAITLVGTVQPARRSRIGSEIAGIVQQMPARQGDFIPDGGVFCRLNDDTLSLQLEEAKARRDALKARHEELLAGSRPEELRRAKAVLDEAESEYERWSFELARVERLYEGSVSNPKELMDTRSDYAQAERRTIAAQASYDLVVAGPRKEIIAQAAFDLAAQEAVVRRIEADHGKTILRAPFAGFVVQRLTEVGEWMPAGGGVVELLDLSSVLVRIDAPEAVKPYLAVGEPVRVTFDALGDAFDGSVKHIIRQADPNARTFPVEIEVDNADGRIAAGMFARATVPAGPKGPVIAVPKDAVVRREHVDYVAVVIPARQGGMAGVLTPVTVGGDVGDAISVTSGNIQAGTPVVIRGNEHILPFPMPVMIVDEKGTPVAAPSAGSADVGSHHDSTGDGPAEDEARNQGTEGATP